MYHSRTSIAGRGYISPCMMGNNVQQDEQRNRNVHPNSNFPERRPSTLSPDIIAPLLLISSGLIFLFFRAYFRARYFDGVPYDGAFQLSNSLERIRLGQLPVRDFVSFHGIIGPLAHYPLYSILGHDLFASEFSRQLLAPLFWTSATTLLVFSLSSDRPKVALYSFAFFVSLVCVGSMEPSTLLQAFILAIPDQPGINMISTRWAYPAACGASLIWATDSDGISPKRATVSGALFGLAPAWSFDHGTLAFLAGLSTMATYALVTRSKSNLHALVLFLTTALSTAALCFHLSTGGHAGETLHFAFQTIPNNQGWFFGALPNPSLSLVRSLLPPSGTHDGTAVASTVVISVVLLYIFLVLLVLGVLVIGIALRRREGAGPRMLVGFGFLFVLSLLSAAPLTGYVWVYYLIGPISSVAIGAITIGSLVLRESPRARTIATRIVGAASLVSLVVAYIYEARAFASTLHSIRSESSETEISGIYPVGMNRSLASLVERVRSVPGATVFSTYRGLLDLATDQPPVGRADYMIHAFDDEEHRRYVEALARGHFVFVHTLKLTYLPYVERLEMSHWDFYRQLVEQYQIVGESELSQLWQRREHPRVLADTKCTQIHPDSAGRWPVADSGNPVFLEVTAEYRTHNPLDGIPIVSNLPRYIIEEEGLASDLPITLSPYHGSATWLVRGLGRPGWLVPRTYPPWGLANLTVDRMTVCEIAIPEDAMAAFRLAPTQQ